MAFQSATGYNNLPTGKFSPVIYSQKVQKQFRKTSVVEDITNSDYFGEISNYGDSVQIIKEPEIAITKYARGTQMVSQDLQDEDFTLIVDRANGVGKAVEDTNGFLTLTKTSTSEGILDLPDSSLTG